MAKAKEDREAELIANLESDDEEETKMGFGGLEIQE